MDKKYEIIKILLFDILESIKTEEIDITKDQFLVSIKEIDEIDLNANDKMLKAAKEKGISCKELLETMKELLTESVEYLFPN